MTQRADRKEVSKPESDLQRSVLVLILALTLVVFMTLALFEHAPEADSSALHHISAPQGQIENLMRRGATAWERGDHIQAEKLFRTALERDPYNHGIINAIGEIALIGQRYDEAAKLFTQYAEFRPEDLHGYTNLAIALLCLNHLDKAEKKALAGQQKFGSRHYKFNLILACIYCNVSPR